MAIRSRPSWSCIEYAIWMVYLFFFWYPRWDMNVWYIFIQLEENYEGLEKTLREVVYMLCLLEPHIWSPEMHPLPSRYWWDWSLADVKNSPWAPLVLTPPQQKGKEKYGNSEVYLFQGHRKRTLELVLKTWT